jgi:hypothetical protein
MSQLKKVSKKLDKHLKKQTAKSNKKRAQEDSDSEKESVKDFDANNFHLDLEQTSINADSLDGDLSEIDWSEEENSMNDE